MEQTRLLIVIVYDKNSEKVDQQVESQTQYLRIKSGDLDVIDIMHIKTEQINLLNEVVNNQQISDVFITHENQVIQLENIRKMLETLHFCEKHGAVVSLNSYSQGICKLTKFQYNKISKYLSDYKVIPYIESYPVIIKIEMFERFGLFDETFESIFGALVDFSLRFNQYGWNTVRANCWNDSKFCFESFFKIDKEIIQKRYPYLYSIEEIYFVRGEKAVEHFASIIIQEKSQNTELLFSLYEVPSAYNGTANYALKLLAAFWKNYHEKYNISILVKKNTDEFFKLSDKYPRVYFPDTIRNHTFHLGYIVSQVLFPEHMDIINTCCLKYCICMLDIICLRSHYLCKNDIDRYNLFRDSIEYSNLMLSISKFSCDDIVSFFHDEIQNAKIKTGYIYLGTDKEQIDIKKLNEHIGPFKMDDYFIVIGNPYKHKMIEPVLEILREIPENFIVIGTKTEGYYKKSKRIYGYVSGWLNNDILSKMIAGAKCIIFPSVYEGFGLTLYDAIIYEKKIIVCDTQVNLELKRLFKEQSSYIIPYRRLEEIKTIILEETYRSSEEKQEIKVRNWNDVAIDLEMWIDDMQNEVISIEKLEYRWKYLKRYQNKNDILITKKNNEKYEKIIARCISRFPRTYKLYRKIVTLIDKEHYGNH